MPVEVMLRDLTKSSGCNLCDRTQISACDRIFMPGKIEFCSMLKERRLLTDLRCKAKNTAF